MFIGILYIQGVSKAGESASPAGAGGAGAGGAGGAGSGGAGGAGGEAGPIKATLPMWRCSKIMQLQREIHPTVLSSLEGIVDQVLYTALRIIVSYLTRSYKILILTTKTVISVLTVFIT